MPTDGAPRTRSPAGPRGVVLAALALALAAGACGPSATITRFGLARIDNELMDPAAYGAEGTIDVLLDAVILGNAIEGGALVGTLTPGSSVSFAVELGAHRIVLVTTGGDASAPYLRSIEFESFVDGGKILIRVTGDGDLCFPESEGDFGCRG